MHQPKSLRRLIVFGKYYLTHFKEVEKWFRTHDRSDLPAPAWVMDNPSGDEPFLGPETDGDPLTNVAATAFLAGRAIRDSEVDCDDRDIVTTANYVMLGSMTHARHASPSTKGPHLHLSTSVDERTQWTH